MQLRALLEEENDLSYLIMTDSKKERKDMVMKRRSKSHEEVLRMAKHNYGMLSPTV